LVLFVQHLLRGSELDWEGTDPSHGVVFATKATSIHLSRTYRRYERLGR
jgi:hypothetical protein